MEAYRDPTSASKGTPEPPLLSPHTTPVGPVPAGDTHGTIPTPRGRANLTLEVKAAETQSWVDRHDGFGLAVDVPTSRDEPIAFADVSTDYRTRSVASCDSWGPLVKGLIVK